MISGESPLHSRLDLASSPSAVRQGRAHVKAVLTKWGLPDDDSANAVLVASELLTNAIMHTAQPDAQGPEEELPDEEFSNGLPDDEPADEAPPGKVCNLLLWYTERGLTVGVYDSDPRPPVPVDASEDAEGGRGLLLISTLAAKWGYTPPSPTSGKLVWARLTVQADLQAQGLAVGA
ncbi:ATP-binding protein [Streptomyces sp. NPDC021224]|uniref:ATP-binding protein n=1 Tax=unclassified Streptomyces TaxID=2593676 RepID=UPI0037A01A6A